MPRPRPPYWAEHLPTRSRGPMVRRSAAAALVASAIAGVTVFAVSPLPEQLGLTASTCDAPKAMRQLSAARQTRSDTRALLADLRINGHDDARAQALANDIAGLGFRPARYSGWRQKAVDVSDALKGTTDPALRPIALTLARRGYGPTPADLLGEDPPPQGGLGDSLNGGTPAIGGAVDSAGQAASSLAQPSQRPTRAGATPGGDQQSEPPLPTTCLSSGEEPRSPGAGAEPLTSARPTAPAAPTVTPSAAVPSTPSSPTGPRTTSSRPSDPPEEDQDSSRSASPTADPTPSISAPQSAAGAVDPSTEPEQPASGSPDGGTDVDRAHAAIQLLAELMQALGAGGGDAGQLHDALQKVIDSGSPTPPTSPDSSTQPSTSESAAPGSTRDDPASETGREPQTGDQVDQSSQPDAYDRGQDSSQPGTGGGDSWAPAADRLAQQVSEAASDDPVARELADKLTDAGITVPESGTTGGEPDSATTEAPQPSDEQSTTREKPSPSDATDEPESGDRTAGADSSDGSSPDTEEPGTDRSGSDDADTGDQISTGGAGDQPTSGGGDGQKPQTNEPETRTPDGGTDPATWDRLADCESSGDWSADTGNGYSGGLQFDPATWEAFGGAGDPASASRDQQIAVAEKVKNEQGWQAWPACSKKLGLRRS